MGKKYQSGDDHEMKQELLPNNIKRDNSSSINISSRNRSHSITQSKFMHMRYK